VLIGVAGEVFVELIEYSDDDKARELLEALRCPESRIHICRSANGSWQSSFYVQARRHQLAPDSPNARNHLQKRVVYDTSDSLCNAASMPLGKLLRTRVGASVTQKNLKQSLAECVDKSAIVNTDDSGESRYRHGRKAACIQTQTETI